MAPGASKPWSLLLVALAAAMLIAAKPAAANAYAAATAPAPAPAPAAAPSADDPYCSSSEHLPPACTADQFSNCKYVPFPFSLIWPSCSLKDKATACCVALEEMGRHRCATCALLKEFDGVPQFDPTECQTGVQDPAKWCKDLCTQNPGDARCKFQ